MATKKKATKKKATKKKATKKKAGDYFTSEEHISTKLFIRLGYNTITLIPSGLGYAVTYTCGATHTVTRGELRSVGLILEQALAGAKSQCIGVHYYFTGPDQPNKSWKVQVSNKTHISVRPPTQVTGVNLTHNQVQVVIDALHSFRNCHD